MRQMTSEDRFSSQNNAGDTTLARTSRIVEDVRVGHQGQVDEVLDLPASKLRPDPIVFAPYFLSGRMRRPIRAADVAGIQGIPQPRGRSDPKSCKA